MATIEERAKTHIDRVFSDMNDFQAGYLIGAEEQKDIDVEEFCEWLKAHAYELATIDIEECIDNFKRTKNG